MSIDGALQYDGGRPLVQRRLHGIDGEGRFGHRVVGGFAATPGGRRLGHDFRDGYGPGGVRDTVVASCRAPYSPLVPDVELRELAPHQLPRVHSRLVPVNQRPLQHVVIAVGHVRREVG